MQAILQSTTSECSLAALAMIARAHGSADGVVELRRRFPVAQRGANLAQVVEQARTLGFTSRPLQLEISELRELHLPCILHWDLNHFVVLAKVGRRHVTILDPAVGERRMRFEEVSRHFTGVALELTPTADFQPQRAAPRLRLSQLTGKVRGLPSSLLQIFAVAAALQLFALVAPLFNQLVVDEVITSGETLAGATRFAAGAGRHGGKATGG